MTYSMECVTLDELRPKDLILFMANPAMRILEIETIISLSHSTIVHSRDIKTKKKNSSGHLLDTRTVFTRLIPKEK